ncbi:polysaccharide pyruvyl transferase family protein [Megamonas hypermegale]|uniref:polysaccharide pyruvyl transferase family protein n=1 Tax=Megamonas hypermegale TaxID=158847 RepID=UPI0026EB77B8|nr:polysaccharide pyruvyl transferase family protein [Megamonas hypermegale]
MKIGILTLNTHNNYGNRLQNYALRKVLLNYADVVDTIWFEKNNYLPDKKIWNIKNIAKYILNWKDSRMYLNKYYIRDCIREYNIKTFSDKYIPIKYDFCIKEDLNNKYDYFIVGSDQVWNPNLWGFSNNDKDFFLNFADKNKRIAYAASFGIEKIPEEKVNLFKDGLKSMKAISVREKEGMKIVKNLINRDVSIVVDPTMLLGKKDWHDIGEKPGWYNGEKYILTYFLGKANKYENLNSIISSLSREKGWKVYNLLDKNSFNTYVSTVEEFIYLIEHAELICADSFHATVCSILMERPFLVVNCNNNEKNNMSSRLFTLLSLFGFEDRFLTVENDKNLSIDDIFEINYSKVNNILNRERKKAISYIETSLEI